MARSARARSALLWLLVSGSFANVARGQSIEGRGRLGLEGSLLHHRAFTLDFGGDTFGDGKLDQKVTHVGPGSGPIGFVLGYGLSENLLLGAQLRVVNQSVTFEDGGSDDVFNFGMLATVAYVAGDGAIRPFIGPIAGIDAADADGSFSKVFEVGAQGGILAFATDDFSIDPSAFVTYGFGSYSDTDVSGYTVGLRLALSGWLGGKDERPAYSPSAPAYAAPPPGAAP